MNINDRYNNLTIISNKFSISQGKTTRLAVIVQCVCGNKLQVKCSNLRNNRVKQCPNCSFKFRELNKQKIPQIEQIFKRLILERSIKNNIKVSITSKDYELICSKNCYYCNEPPKDTGKFKMRKYINTEELKLNGIDRINSKEGYTIENCVSCCTSCNYAKHTLTKQDFINKIIKIYENLQLHKTERS